MPIMETYRFEDNVKEIEVRFRDNVLESIEYHSDDVYIHIDLFSIEDYTYRERKTKLINKLLDLLEKEIKGMTKADIRKIVEVEEKL